MATVLLALNSWTWGVYPPHFCAGQSQRRSRQFIKQPINKINFKLQFQAGVEWFEPGKVRDAKGKNDYGSIMQFVRGEQAKVCKIALYTLMYELTTSLSRSNCRLYSRPRSYEKVPLCRLMYDLPFHCSLMYRVFVFEGDFVLAETGAIIEYLVSYFAICVCFITCSHRN